MTTIQEGQISTTISSTITAGDGTNIIIVVDNDVNTFKSAYGITEPHVGVTCFVDEIYCFAETKSLPEAPPIQFEATDTRDDRAAKALAYEWGNNPRVELRVWTRKNPGTTISPTPWRLVGSVSLMNPAGYPWRRYRLLDLLTDNLGRKLGSGSQVGVSLRDVGFGLIAPTDIVNIDGCFTQEVVIFNPTNPNVQYNNYNFSLGTTKAILMETNEYRSSFNVTNNSLSQTVYLDYSPNVSTTIYTAALTPGQNHVGASAYKGVISVIGSAGNAKVTAREALF